MRPPLGLCAGRARGADHSRCATAEMAATASRWPSRPAESRSSSEKGSHAPASSWLMPPGLCRACAPPSHGMYSTASKVRIGHVAAHWALALSACPS